MNKQFFDELYDDSKKDDEDPSFSFGEFKKWLSKEKKLMKEAKRQEEERKKKS